MTLQLKKNPFRTHSTTTDNVTGRFEETAMFLKGLSRRQACSLAVFVAAQYFSAICVSILAPFYPAEADQRGASALEYGLVFGVFEFAVFAASPVMGSK